MTIADQLRQAGLTGRGGAAFATAVKVEALASRGTRLIVNACDGELGAVKDGWVVEHRLDELVQGAGLISRRDAQYAAHRGSATATRLAAAGLDVLEVPHRYVSSEESALVARAAGDLARPLTKRVPIAFGATLTDGRRVRPTVVLNAETVWRIAQIAADGPEWFRAQGTVAEPGPRLVGVGGAVGRPGVVEVAAGVPIATIVAAAGGYVGTPGPVSVSGLSGGLLTAAEAATAQWSNTALAAFGIGMGCGTITCLAGQECPLETVRSWIEYAAGETAGQCGPCMFGVPAAAAELVAIIDGHASRDATSRLRARIDLLRGRGACRFPDGVAGFIASVLRAFPDHLAAHAESGRCDACATTRRLRRYETRSHAVVR